MSCLKHGLQVNEMLILTARELKADIRCLINKVTNRELIKFKQYEKQS